MFRSLLNAALAPLSEAVAAENTSAPTEEIDVLIVAVTVAVFLANAGKAADGYACLIAGLARAEGASRAGEGWADELVTRYREVMTNFARRYGIAVD